MVLAFPHYDLRQGYEWGEVRASQGWYPWRLAVFQDGECVAAMSLLARYLPGLGRSILYAPGGPLVTDAACEAAWEGILMGLRSVAAHMQAVFVRVNPTLPDTDERLRGALVTRGFQHLADDWTAWNVPRITMTMDLSAPEDVLKCKLRKRYREYITSAPDGPSKQGAR